MTEWNRFKHIQLGTLATLGFSERCPVWGPPGQLSWKPDFAGVPSCMCLNRCLWPGRARIQLNSRGRILGRIPSRGTCDRTQVQRLNHWMWLDKMLLTWRVRLGALFRCTSVWIQACMHVCMGVSMDGQIQEWQTGTQGWTFPGNWIWLLGGSLNLPNKTVWVRWAWLALRRQERWPDAVWGSGSACLAESSWTLRTGFVSERPGLWTWHNSPWAHWLVKCDQRPH